VDPQVIDTLQAILHADAGTGNPQAKHYAGFLASQAIQQAADQVAALLHCNPAEILWTSGATQSIDWALRGCFEGYPGKTHIITMNTEHQAVLNACERLEKRGASITRLQPNSDGMVNLGALEKSIRPETLMISIMHVNNETGQIQDIEAIGALARQARLLFHVDATQSLGKLPLDMALLPVDLLSASAHKIHGPKGVGLLFARIPVQAHLAPMGGTLATHQIAGFGVAASLALAHMGSELGRMVGLKAQLWAGLAGLPGVFRVGEPETCSPYILNLGFEGIAAESWMEALPQLAFSAGSACNSSGLSSSIVLKSLGLNEAEAKASLRFSFGRMTTSTDIDGAIRLITGVYEQLRSSEHWWR
jgi:cysteine desulfurase